MWNDLIIGKGEKLSGAELIITIEGDHSISENSVSYCISHSFLNLIDFGLTIYKNTKEGKELKELIDKKTPLYDINEWIDR